MGSFRPREGGAERVFTAWLLRVLRHSPSVESKPGRVHAPREYITGKLFLKRLNYDGGHCARI